MELTKHGLKWYNLHVLDIVQCSLCKQYFFFVVSKSNFDAGFAACDV